MSADRAVHVYKIGGPALEDPGLVGPLADEVRRLDGRAVLVHGGGRHIERMLKALGHRVALRRRSPLHVGRGDGGGGDGALRGREQGPRRGAHRRGDPRGRASRAATAGLVRARLEDGLGRVGTPEAVDPAPLSGPVGGRAAAGRLPGLLRPLRGGGERERRRGGPRPRPRPRRAHPRLPLRRRRGAGGRGDGRDPHAGRGAATDRGRDHRRRDGPQGPRGPRGLRRRHPRGGDRGQGSPPRHVLRHAPRLRRRRPRDESR